VSKREIRVWEGPYQYNLLQEVSEEIILARIVHRIILSKFYLCFVVISEFHVFLLVMCLRLFYGNKIKEKLSCNLGNLESKIVWSIHNIELR
jgi:hypothetical protein